MSKVADIIEISLQPGVQPQIDAALAMRAAGRLQEALRALAQPSEYSAHLYTIRGEIEFALDRFQDAALSYFAVVHSEPGNADAHYNLALCLQRSDRWDASCQAFERALSLDSSRESARLGLGASLLYLNRLEEALATFQQCSEAVAGPALFGKAVALQLMHRCGEAEAAYEMLLARDPSSTGASSTGASSAGASSASARSTHPSSTGASSTYPSFTHPNLTHSNPEETLSNLIALAVETQDFDRVRDYSQRLLKIAPQSPAAWQGLAAAALDRRDHHAAARYCDRILQLAPDCLEAWHNLSVALNRILRSFSAPRPVAAVPAPRPAQWEVS
jgi:tetratricopeptide (TPR) repeat protein